MIFRLETIDETRRAFKENFEKNLALVKQVKAIAQEKHYG